MPKLLHNHTATAFVEIKLQGFDERKHGDQVRSIVKGIEAFYCGLDRVSCQSEVLMIVGQQDAPEPMPGRATAGSNDGIVVGGRAWGKIQAPISAVVG